MIARLRELRLENGTIGLTRSQAHHGGMSHGLFAALQLKRAERETAVEATLEPRADPRQR